MQSPLTSNDQHAPSLPKNLHLCSQDPSKHQESQSLSIDALSQKAKKISRKPQSILRKLTLEHPMSFNHVHCIFDMMGLNESALRNNNFEESFFKTMFYVKTVERVELRKHAIILQLKPLERMSLPIEYIIERFKSFGDLRFYQLAMSIEALASKIKIENFTKKLMKSFDGEPLSRFIDSMEGQIYMCRVAPNKLVISRGLLELLGEDPECYAVELCKYKTPIREIISAQSYDAIMHKSLENMGLVCDFINGMISPDELHAQSSLNFTDYLYNRQHKKIYCSLVLFMPTPQMSCIQVREVLRESEETKQRCGESQAQRRITQTHFQQMRYSEAEVLRKIIRMPEGLLRQNSKKVAGYREIPTLS